MQWLSIGRLQQMVILNCTKQSLTLWAVTSNTHGHLLHIYVVTHAVYTCPVVNMGEKRHLQRVRLTLCPA